MWKGCRCGGCVGVENMGLDGIMLCWCGYVNVEGVWV